MRRLHRLAIIPAALDITLRVWDITLEASGITHQVWGITRREWGITDVARDITREVLDTTISVITMPPPAFFPQPLSEPPPAADELALMC